MTVTARRVTVGAWSRNLGPDAIGLGVIATVSPVLVVLAADAAGDVPWWVYALVMPSAFLLTDRPDGVSWTGYWLLMLVGWLVWVPGPTWWAVAAAAAALLGHTATALLAVMPEQVRLPPQVLRRYAVRLGLVLAATLAVAAAVNLAGRSPVPGGAAYAAAGLLVLAILVTAWRRR